MLGDNNKLAQRNKTQSGGGSRPFLRYLPITPLPKTHDYAVSHFGYNL